MAVGEIDHNRQKKIALISDFSGFGRCSIAVEQPIISVMGVQCCPIPTAVFSNHTGFPSFFRMDYTPYIEQYIGEWKKLGLQFRGIATGFLGSAKQIELVKRFFQDFKSADTLVVLDPVMGDYGKLYPSYSEELSARMHELVPYADILLPNLTEACILTKTPYRTDFTDPELNAICKELSEHGPAKIVISGITNDQNLGNYVWERGKDAFFIWTERIGGYRSGSGDVFCAIIAADVVNGVPFAASVKKAAAFISEAVRESCSMELPLTDGLAIETCLWKLGTDFYDDYFEKREKR